MHVVRSRTTSPTPSRVISNCLRVLGLVAVLAPSNARERCSLFIDRISSVQYSILIPAVCLILYPPLSPEAESGSGLGNRDGVISLKQLEVFSFFRLLLSDRPSGIGP